MESTVNIRKFKEIVFSKISKEDSLYKMVRSKPDEIPTEEAIYITSTVMDLIGHSKVNQESPR